VFRDQLYLHAALLTAALGMGCLAEPVGPVPGADGGTGLDGSLLGPDGSIVLPDGGVVENQIPESEKARVQFKRQRRLRADFAAALGFSADEVCKELDRFDCFVTVHNISLGGVDAYNLGIFEPLEETTKTTPIAMERIALTGCRNRVDLDLDTPESALIFKNLAMDASGGLADVNAASVDDAIDALYKRFALRRANPEEIAELRGFYETVTASGDTKAARSWAILACFMVSTSVESLFY
jgi:hypothetical protein